MEDVEFVSQATFGGEAAGERGSESPPEMRGDAGTNSAGDPASAAQRAEAEPLQPVREPQGQPLREAHEHNAASESREETQNIPAPTPTTLDEMLAAIFKLMQEQSRKADEQSRKIDEQSRKTKEQSEKLNRKLDNKDQAVRRLNKRFDEQEKKLQGQSLKLEQLEKRVGTLAAKNKKSNEDVQTEIGQVRKDFDKS
ncbi:uncharacterized protein LOC124803356 [Schistocerca piceifrons]|uniref:uncharacterized protein LOC124803356 n=1 Tax=Schistocerca piceifrons TaxID=274613 RepID=UPI001F5F1434|nr:uncharacterized protein LOC124803356 [Schistocerca piceifrons]